MSLRPRSFIPRLSLLMALFLPSVASAQQAPVERLSGPIESEVENYQSALERFQGRMVEFNADVRAIVDQMEVEERDRLTLMYNDNIDELEASEGTLRDLAIQRLEYFLTKYPDSEYTPHVMFRLAQLYVELSYATWLDAAVAYTELEMATPDDEQLFLPDPPRIDYSKALALYQNILANHPEYEYRDGAYYMMGFIYFDSNSVQAEEWEAEDIARENFQALVDNYPESPFAIDGNYILGDLHFANNEVEEAVPYFQAVVDRPPPDNQRYDEGVYMLAWSHYKLSNYEKTLNLFTDLLDYSDTQFAESGRESPLRPEAVRYAAISFSDLADKSLTLEDPDWREYSGNDMEQVSKLFASIGLPQSQVTPVMVAQAWFKKVGTREYEPDLYKALADVLVEQARYEEAIAAYETIQTTWPDDPDNPTYQWEVARLYLNLPIPDPDAQAEALAVLNERYSEESDWWEANRNNPDAQSTARRYIEESLLNVAVEYHLRAQRSGSVEDYSRAADGYQNYLQKFPFADNYYEAQWYLADTLYASKRFDEAEEQYLQLLKAGGHPYVDGSQYQLFKTRLFQLEEAYGAVGSLPQDAVVASTETTDAGQERQIYALGDLHREFIESADALREFGFTDQAYKDAARDDESAAAYIPAQIFYEHGDYSQARPRLQHIIDTYCETDEGSYAQTMMINTYVAEGNLEKVLELTRTYIPMQCGETVGTPEEWKDLEAGAAYKLAQRLYDAGDYLASAEAFEAYRAEYDEYQKESLLSAASSYEKGGKADKANELFETFINEYPSDENSAGLYYRIATNYAGILELDKAVTYYENLYKYFGPGSSYARKNEGKADPNASAALYMAGFLRIGQGDHRGAAENFTRYAQQFPDAIDAEQVRWLANEEWEKVGDKEGRAAYQDYLKWSEKNEDPSPNHVIDSHYWLVQYYQRTGDQRKEEQAWADLTQAYNSLASAGKIQAGSIAANRAAEAAFRDLEALYEDFADDDYPRKKDSETLKAFLLDEGSKLDEYVLIEQEALKIIERYADFEYSSAAIYIWGKSYIRMAEYLYDAPMPTDLSALAQGDEDFLWELETQWESALSDLAIPLEEKAIARFEANLTKSANEKRSSVWIDRSILALNDINPSQYPLEKAELRGQAAAAVMPSVDKPIEQAEPEPTADEAEGAQ